MNAEKTSDSLTAEILHELSDLDHEDLELIMKSWKATKKLNKRPGYENVYVIFRKK